MLDKETIRKNTRKKFEENVYFSFPDSEKQYYDLIKVEIKRDDFNRLLSVFKFEYTKLKDTYKGYCVLTSILEAYNIPYTILFLIINMLYSVNTILHQIWQ